MKKLTSTIITIHLFIHVNAFAQMLNFSEVHYEYFDYRVVSIESFIKRFNLSEDYKGNAIDKETNKKLSIIHLFDEKYVKNIKNKNIVGRFLSMYDETETIPYLSFHNDNWAAIVTLNVVNNNKKISDISLLLNPKLDHKQSEYWSISHFIYKDSLYAIQEAYKLRPNAHGTNFMAIKDEIKLIFKLEPFKSVINYQYEDVVIKDVAYHILQIPGWYITVKEKSGNSYNTGWLITDLKNADTTKNIYHNIKMNYK